MIETGIVLGQKEGEGLLVRSEGGVEVVVNGAFPGFTPNDQIRYNLEETDGGILALADPEIIRVVAETPTREGICVGQSKQGRPIEGRGFPRWGKREDEMLIVKTGSIPSESTDQGLYLDTAIAGTSIAIVDVYDTKYPVGMSSQPTNTGIFLSIVGFGPVYTDIVRTLRKAEIFRTENRRNYVDDTVVPKPTSRGFENCVVLSRHPNMVRKMLETLERKYAIGEGTDATALRFIDVDNIYMLEEEKEHFWKEPQERKNKVKESSGTLAEQLVSRPIVKATREHYRTLP